MENKQSMTTSTFGILAVILGISVYKEFNFETLKFKNIGLGIVYLIAFGMSIFFIVKSKKTKE